MIGTYLVAFVNAVLAMAITFGLNLSQNEVGAIIGTVNAGLLFVTAIAHWYSNRKTSTITPPVAAPPRSNL